MAYKFTVTDIFTRVQRTFGDESAIQVTEADVIRWINDAQREAAMQHEGLLLKRDTIDSVTGTQEYALPEDLFTLQSVYYSDGGNYYALRYLEPAKLNDYASGWNNTSQDNRGYPIVYSYHRQGFISLFPVPDESVTGGIRVEYARYPVDLVDNTDEIDLPVYYHGYVEHFCMMKAYEMDEDWEAVGQKASIVQSTLDFNNNREAWFGRETYPVVSSEFEDFI